MTNSTNHDLCRGIAVSCWVPLLAFSAWLPAAAQAAPSLYAPPSMIVGTVPTGQSPSVVAVNPATHKVYVANEGDLTLSVLDGVALRVIATLPIGIGSHALAVNPTTNRIYVANLGSSLLHCDRWSRGPRACERHRGIRAGCRGR